jgi:ubiquinone/menaquinone biosynthesis C-methylase UbiE
MDDVPIAAGHSSFILTDPEKVLAELGVGEGSRLLDLACGRGQYSLFASGHVGDEGVIYAVDLWEEGMADLEREIAGRGIGNIRSIVADASVSIPIDPGSVDICLMAAVLHDLVEDGTHEGTLDQVRRVLATGTVLGILEFRKVEPPPGPPLSLRLAPSQVDAMICSRGFTKRAYVEVGEYMYLSTYKRVS